MDVNKKRPLISVILPVHNERDSIERCLKTIKNQSYPELEIIVIDNLSNDDSMEMAKKYTDRVILERHKGISFTKNTGLKVAKGEFVATTDADCIPDKNWLEELIKHFNDPLVGSVGGTNILPNNASDFEKCIDFLLRTLGSIFKSKYVSDIRYVTETFHNPGCNVMYRKSILQELGGFNERFLTVEDEELDFRIRKRGYKILFTPFAKVYHNRRSNWKKFVKQVYRYAIGRARFIKLHPNMAQWPRLIPSILILFSIFLFIIGLFNPMFLKLLSVESLIGIGGWLLVAYYLALKSEKRHFPVYLFLLFLTFWVWGIGLIRGLWHK